MSESTQDQVQNNTAQELVEKIRTNFQEIEKMLQEMQSRLKKNK